MYLDVKNLNRIIKAFPKKDGDIIFNIIGHNEVKLEGIECYFTDDPDCDPYLQITLSVDDSDKRVLSNH